LLSVLREKGRSVWRPRERENKRERRAKKEGRKEGRNRGALPGLFLDESLFSPTLLI
jgi:hypothetical protein